MGSLLPLAAVGVLAILVAAVAARRRERAWRAFARYHGLEFRRAHRRTRPLVHGTIEGRLVELYRVRRGPLARGGTCLAVVLRGELPRGLEVVPRTLLLVRAAHELATGDPEFDALARVIAPDARAALAYLDAGRRLALQNVLETGAARCGGIREGRLFLGDRGVPGEPGAWNERLALLLGAARVLDGRHARSGGGVMSS